MDNTLTEDELNSLGGPDSPWIKDDWDGLLEVIENIIASRRPTDDSGIRATEIDTPDEIKEVLAWLNEATPRDPLFSRLVREGAGLDPEEETYTMKLDGDDLAGFCHAINTLYEYFDFNPKKDWWDQ